MRLRVPEDGLRSTKEVEGREDGVDEPRGTLADVAFIEAALNSDGKPVDLVKLLEG